MQNAILAIICIAIALGAIFFIAGNKSNYNDGTCPDCGIEYKERSYIYDGDSWLEFKCDSCGKQGILQERFVF